MLNPLYLAVKICHNNPQNTGIPCMSFQKNPYQLSGASTMSREQKSNKEDKKKPALSPKEKKAVKKSKKDSKS
jgi:hypothetical protein